MGSLRQALPGGDRGVELDLKRAARVLIALPLALALAAALTSTGGGPVPRTASAHSPQGAGALAGLPPAVHASISAALGRDDARYQATRASDGALTAANPRHGLDATFRSQGVHITTGAGSLALSLRSAGRGSGLRPVAPASPAARTNRIEYHRGPLVEWYVNGPAGLEQGFTLASAPSPRSGAPVTLRIAVGGTLAAVADRDGIALLRGDGAVLRYRGLAAWDVTGRPLPASLDLAGHSLVLRVDDRSATYPLTIDPFVEKAALRASDGAAGDELGSAVAVSGDTIVAGAVGDDGLRGSAYVFVKPAAGWSGVLTERAKLTASDSAAGDAFGYAVASNGDTIVVGAYGDDAAEGSAYVFKKPAGGWTGTPSQSAKLTASTRTPGAFFGLSVAVDGGTVVAGAHGERPGAAYVFVEPASGWAGTLTQSARLTPSSSATAALFGWAVAVSGGTIAVGAYGESSSRGAAYVFNKPAAGWSGSLTENAKLTASGGAAGDQFGSSIAASGQLVIAGAPSADSSKGAAYVFQRPAAGWSGSPTENARLRASAANTSEELGVSVSASGDVVVAGSWGDDGFAGAVYVFNRPAAGWAGTLDENQRLTAADGQAGDSLGGTVAVDGSTLVAGASADDGDRGSARVFAAGVASGDTAPPVTTITLSPSSPDGPNGWYRTPVNVTASATDPSGVAELRCAVDPAAAPAAFADLAAACPFAGAGGTVGGNGAHAVYAAARDSAGNAGSPVSASFKIDRTAPTVTCDNAPALSVGSTGGAITATVTDGTSGPAAASVSTPTDASSAGWKWASLTGFDRAGNSTTVRCGYLVGYAVSFDPGLPTRPPGVNAGAAVPVRFALTDAAGTPIGDTEAAALAAACAVRIRLDGGEPGCARYDALTDRFTYVLKTPKELTPGTHSVVIETVFTGGTSSTSVPLLVK